MSENVVDEFAKALAEVEKESPIPVDSLAPELAGAGKRDHDALDREQTLALRYAVSGFVGILLIIELLGLFMIVVWQGRGHFKLGDTVFGVLTTGVLLQTFYSFRTIVTHLFPQGAKDFNGKG